MVAADGGGWHRATCRASEYPRLGFGGRGVVAIVLAPSNSAPVRSRGRVEWRHRGRGVSEEKSRGGRGEKVGDDRRGHLSSARGGCWARPAAWLAGGPCAVRGAGLRERRAAGRWLGRAQC